MGNTGRRGGALPRAASGAFGDLKRGSMRQRQKGNQRQVTDRETEGGTDRTETDVMAGRGGQAVRWSDIDREPDEEKGIERWTLGEGQRQLGRLSRGRRGSK